MSDILASWSEENLFYAVCRSSFHCVIVTHINWVCWAVKYQQNAIHTWYVSRFKSRIYENLESWHLSGKGWLFIHQRLVYILVLVDPCSLFFDKIWWFVWLFFGNDELPSQALTEKVTSTTLFSLFNPSSCSHLFEIKGLLQCVFENWKLVIFHIWKKFYGLASIFFLCIVRHGEIDRHLCSDRIWQGRVEFSQLFTFLSKHSQF